ncbi:MAG: hypothetical protein ACLP50_16485 [Solirubrobacteraceae bacterium]
MPAVASEPALGFWLSYAEQEGALVEDHGDHALVVLPGESQRETGLPEELTVTSDPDLAREDGAVLMVAGHPAVEQAASAVLAAGDVGSAYLPWPSSRPPLRSALEAIARERAPVDRGLIDAAGEPIAAYLPLLRAGAMVTYAASLSDRFQEQEEVWVDARTGIEPTEAVLAATCGRPLLARPDGPRRVLEADRGQAVAAAHAQLERRAAARQAVLAAHARHGLELELARADAYYDGALASIERRRATATEDRVRLLDSQAATTQAERARRQREIEEEHRPRHTIRPFRLHLIHVPALLLLVEIRRGSRAFRFELAWIAPAGEFAPVRCPACGAAAALVATRERLACQRCVGRTA